MAAALSRRYAQDERALLQALAALLQTALPEETKVDRQGGLLSPRTIKRVSVSLEDVRYTLESAAHGGHGPLRAGRTRVVRGIALKTEGIAVDTWLAELGAALDDRARGSAATREVLARVVG